MPVTSVFYIRLCRGRLDGVVRFQKFVAKKVNARLTQLQSGGKWLRRKPSIYFCN
jgi:hypothetical protein